MKFVAVMVIVLAATHGFWLIWRRPVTWAHLGLLSLDGVVIGVATGVGDSASFGQTLTWAVSAGVGVPLLQLMLHGLSNDEDG